MDNRINQKRNTRGNEWGQEIIFCLHTLDLERMALSIGVGMIALEL